MDDRNKYRDVIYSEALSFECRSVLSDNTIIEEITSTAPKTAISISTNSDDDKNCLTSYVLLDHVYGMLSNYCIRYKFYIYI